MTLSGTPKILVLTPVKNAAAYLDGYVALLERLDWPRECLSLGLLESDSVDDTAKRMQALLPRMQARAASVTMATRNFGFQMPPHLPRWTPAFQLARRAILAKSRNHLLFAALRDQDWVLWIDVDVIGYPSDTLHRLLAEKCDILTPNCVTVAKGQSFDRNAWCNDGKSHLHDLRGSEGPVRLQSVGGCMLLVRANLHRDGLIFPAFRYGVANTAIRNPHPVWGSGEIETEGLAMMAADMGVQCWGLPDFEIFHAES